jgi:hypothetical protein
VVFPSSLPFGAFDGITPCRIDEDHPSAPHLLHGVPIVFAFGGFSRDLPLQIDEDHPCAPDLLCGIPVVFAIIERNIFAKTY